MLPLLVLLGLLGSDGSDGSDGEERIVNLSYESIHHTARFECITNAMHPLK
jgi:hypothetical protein